MKKEQRTRIEMRRSAKDNRMKTTTRSPHSIATTNTRRRARLRTACTVFAVAAITIPAARAQNAEPASEAPPVEPADARPARASSRASAEEVLRELRRRRPANEIIPSVRHGENDPKSAAAKLLPEGWTVVDELGQITRGEKGWTFKPQREEFPDLPLLQNATLELVVRTVTASPRALTFKVSGHHTVFEGENHLFLRAARRPTDGDVEQAPSPPDPAREPLTAEEVLEKMKRAAPEDELVNFEADRRTSRILAESATGRVLIPDGTPLTRRPGRIVPDHTGWVFTPESDHPDHPEASLTLLPCAHTERMIDIYQRDDAGLVFIVSGEITQYRGDNYLLPSMAVQRVGYTNFRK